jgi:hypothetical protein
MKNDWRVRLCRQISRFGDSADFAGYTETAAPLGLYLAHISLGWR